MTYNKTHYQYKRSNVIWSGAYVPSTVHFYFIVCSFASQVFLSFDYFECLSFSLLKCDKTNCIWPFIGTKNVIITDLNVIYIVSCYQGANTYLANFFRFISLRVEKCGATWRKKKNFWLMICFCRDTAFVYFNQSHVHPGNILSQRDKVTNFFFLQQF